MGSTKLARHWGIWSDRWAFVIISLREKHCWFGDFTLDDELLEQAEGLNCLARGLVWYGLLLKQSVTLKCYNEEKKLWFKVQHFFSPMINVFSHFPKHLTANMICNGYAFDNRQVEKNSIKILEKIMRFKMSARIKSAYVNASCISVGIK